MRPGASPLRGFDPAPSHSSTMPVHSLLPSHAVALLALTGRSRVPGVPVLAACRGVAS